MAATTRILATALILSAAILLPAGAGGAGLVGVGETVPDLALPTLDGETRQLSERDAPTVLVFFRGVW